MCRERALLAEKDLRYWLEEAEEWARFKEAQSHRSIALRFKRNWNSKLRFHYVVESRGPRAPAPW
jgi:hypothetical protein